MWGDPRWACSGRGQGGLEDSLEYSHSDGKVRPKSDANWPFRDVIFEIRQKTTAGTSHSLGKSGRGPPPRRVPGRVVKPVLVPEASRRLPQSDTNKMRKNNSPNAARIRVDARQASISAGVRNLGDRGFRTNGSKDFNGAYEPQPFRGLEICRAKRRGILGPVIRRGHVRRLGTEQPGKKWLKGENGEA